jgi:hypothetical protein
MSAMPTLTRHRRIEMFLNVLVRVAEQARGELLTEEQRGAWETALRYNTAKNSSVSII